MGPAFLSSITEIVSKSPTLSSTRPIFPPSPFLTRTASAGADAPALDLPSALCVTRAAVPGANCRRLGSRDIRSDFLRKLRCTGRSHTGHSKRNHQQKQATTIAWNIRFSLRATAQEKENQQHRHRDADQPDEIFELVRHPLIQDSNTAFHTSGPSLISK
jgi:hypothetical protein